MPGCYFQLGVRRDQFYECHDPRFDIDESALPVGAAVLAATAERLIQGIGVGG